MAFDVQKIQGVEFNHEAKATFDSKDMTKAFKNIELALNEVIYSAEYLSDEGYSSSLVTGIKPVFTLNGDYIKDDEFCQYMAEKQWKTGADRVGTLSITRAGQTISCSATLTGIAITGGASTAPNAISVTIATNGKPTITAAANSGE